MRISDWSSDVCSSDLGRVRPTSGRVLFHGEAIQNELEHRIVGKGICRKFQTPGVLIGLSVIDNLAPSDWIMPLLVRLASDSFSVSPRRTPLWSEKLVLPPVMSSSPWARMPPRSEEHTSELQSLMRISYAVFCLKQKNTN